MKKIQVAIAPALVLMVAGAIAAYILLLPLSPGEPVSITLTLPRLTPSFDFLWAYAGVEAGIFEQEGIDLEILQSSSPSTAV